jgi:hypothetical protein
MYGDIWGHMHGDVCPHAHSHILSSPILFQAGCMHLVLNLQPCLKLAIESFVPGEEAITCFFFKNVISNFIGCFQAEDYINLIDLLLGRLNDIVVGKGMARPATEMLPPEYLEKLKAEASRLRVQAEASRLSGLCINPQNNKVYLQL